MSENNYSKNKHSKPSSRSNSSGSRSTARGSHTDSTNYHQQKMLEVQEKLESGLREIYSSDKYRDYITAMSKFPHYSINNCILIASQKPTASLVCGFHKWQTDFNRTVNKGERGIMILAPIKRKADLEEPVHDKDGNPVLDEIGNPLMHKVTREFASFRPVYVFDVSQTNGDPIPTLATELTDPVKDFEALKQTLMEIAPVPVSFAPIPGEVHGYYSPTEQKIVIDQGMPELQTIKTMIHEIAHATLKHGSKEDKWDRETHEVQAESVAYWVTQLLGLDTSDYSFGYITGWSKDREVSELKENLELIKTTSDELSQKITKALSERLANVDRPEVSHTDGSEQPIEAAPESSPKPRRHFHR
jgi:hypothetical protein